MKGLNEKLDFVSPIFNVFWHWVTYAILTANKSV